LTSTTRATTTATTSSTSTATTYAVSPEIRITDDLGLLLEVLPPRVRDRLDRHPKREDLIEIVLDLGRPPEARFTHDVEDLSGEPVEREDLDYVVERVGRFGQDNRAGIERTLHRISAIRNRDGGVVGLTCRVGRAVFGTVDVARDVVESGRSVLLLGRPGVGKTTLLREAARVLADDLGKRVVVVDTSNEIAGDGDIPHPGIGRARRMQVPSPREQHAVMIEAVENHMPEVIVIDEIGTEAEALAARTIAERGVQLIATAHGNTLQNLIQNPTLSDLVGGIQAVTLSDEEARRRGTQKTVLERKAPPTFDVVIEIQQKDRLAVHHDVGEVLDLFLRGAPLAPELRVRTREGVEIERPEPADGVETGDDRMELAGTGVAGTAPTRFPGAGRGVTGMPGMPSTAGPARGDLRRLQRRVRVFPYAVSRSKLERAMRKLQAPVRLVNDLRDADLVLTTKAHDRRQPRRLRDAQSRGTPVHVVRNNTVTQMENFLRRELGIDIQESAAEQERALAAVERGIREARDQDHPVELPPQTSYMRRLQHELVHDHGLTSRSRGQEPYRRVVIYPQ
jgi:stage III sporulation protein SpoIIIAA